MDLRDAGRLKASSDAEKEASLRGPCGNRRPRLKTFKLGRVVSATLEGMPVGGGGLGLVANPARQSPTNQVPRFEATAKYPCSMLTCDEAEVNNFQCQNTLKMLLE
eukprot:6475598-Amphidinium_carterae.1